MAETAAATPGSSTQAGSPSGAGSSASSSGSSGSSSGSSSLARQGESQLLTDQGVTTIADSVVAKIAGVAAREIDGVHSMGGSAGRAIGAIREKMGSQPAVSQGVKVEVGQRQAAVDLDIIVDYGVSIPDLASGIRSNVVERVESMTGLEVTEVNVSVNDVYLGETEDESEPRVS